MSEEKELKGGSLDCSVCDAVSQVSEIAMGTGVAWQPQSRGQNPVIWAGGVLMQIKEITLGLLTTV